MSGNYDDATNKIFPINVVNGTAYAPDLDNLFLVTLKCNAGYQPDGPTFSLWDDVKMSWDLPELKCIPMTLDTLPAVENGTLEQVQRNDKDASPPYQTYDTVLPKCYNGYEFRDTKAILLPNQNNSGLVWAPSTLTCKPMQTEERPQVRNGRLVTVRNLPGSEYLSPGSLALNDYVNLKCDHGYISKQRSSTLTVDQHNRLVWEPAVLSCEPMTIRTQPKLVGGHYTFYTNPPYIIGDKAKIHCDPGSYSTLQIAQVILKANKLVWSPEVLYCQPMTLNTLPVVENGKAVLKKPVQSPYGIGTRVTINCDHEHSTADTESEIVIDPDTGMLKWHPDNIRCKRINCPEPPKTLTGNVTVVGSGRSFGDRIEYKCRPDFVAMGRFKNSSRLEPIANSGYWCNPEGKWMPELPEDVHCLGLHCPELKQPENAHLNYSRVKDGIATYTCVKDRTVITRKCQADGTWSGKEPKCPNIHFTFNFKWILLIFLLVIAAVLFTMKT